MLSFGKQGFLRLTGPGGLRVLKLDSGFAAEGCGGALTGADKGAARPPGGQRVQKVQRVQRVQRGGSALAGEWHLCQASIVPPRSGGKVVAPATKGGEADWYLLQMSHYRHVPRFFAALRMAVSGVKTIP